MAWIRSHKRGSSGQFNRYEIDNSTLISGIYIDENNGSDRYQGDWSATPYLPVRGTELYFTGGILGYSHNIYNAFYDENKNYVSRLTYANPDSVVTIPSNARYMRLSCRTGLFTSNHYFME